MKFHNFEKIYNVQYSKKKCVYIFLVTFLSPHEMVVGGQKIWVVIKKVTVQILL
jgi:hypothetical protein